MIMTKETGSHNILLDVKHRVAHIRMDLDITLLSNSTATLRTNHAGSRGRRRGRIEEVAQVAAGTGADQIGVVGRRAHAHSLGGAAEEIAHFVVRVCNSSAAAADAGCRGWKISSQTVK